MTAPNERPDVDVVVVGAGMAGLYLLHRLRGLGFTARCFEAADDVGGTWYWNRYPGARCDVESIDYSYSFDPELEAEWEWSERYATQPEILRYLQHVADRFDLRRDITFETRVDAAVWDDANQWWRITTSGGEQLTARHHVMATGCLSVPKEIELPGHDTFEGEVYVTGRWPHEGVDFTGKRVAVVGTGSSAIQSIPIIADQAEQLTVFQRTPNYSMPAHNGPPSTEKLERFRADPAAYREAARWSRAGVPIEPTLDRALDVDEAERNRRYEEGWAEGGLFAASRQFADLLVSEEANDTLASFIRSKIDDIVDDPDVAATLSPTSYPFGTKRPCLDDGYYAVFNEPHVRLVDLNETPIGAVTPTGIDTSAESFGFDAIVYATGFDAMTGAIVAVDIEGRDGITLKEKWADGPQTYLGLTSVGFPNLFLVTGPQSPSVLSNMAVSIEQHVEWITDTLAAMRDAGHTTIEPTETAEAGWGVHTVDCAAITLFPQAASWYMGANVPGKPRVFLPYVGGVDTYRRTCDKVVEQDYLGFRLRGPDGEQCNDGVVNRTQPDVQLLLDAMAELDLPPLESLGAEGAREFSAASNTMRPPGPDVGEIVDGTFDGADGPLAYRLYRPATPGPHPVVAYFHGGGWVLGSADSDDPFCRDLCDRTGSLVVSFDYRHGPEARFPAAYDDAVAAVRWLADHAAELGGSEAPFVVAGWSAGANQAAVVALAARDAGGPALAGQVLITPVTDAAEARPSRSENGEGYILTESLMDWFLDNYVDEPDRADPRISPIRADDLSGLPPALIVTSEFDPLRDEGIAYAEALRDAGVEVEHVAARGHLHTTIHAVDVVISAIPIRERIAEAVRRFGARVPTG